MDRLKVFSLFSQVLIVCECGQFVIRTIERGGKFFRHFFLLLICSVFGGRKVEEKTVFYPVINSFYSELYVGCV